jgi:ketosteroid isomerase-like protein
MDHDGVQRWLDSYVAAWRSNDRAEVEALFTENAEYHFHPWGEPLVGAAAIADAWVSNPDDPDSWEAEYEPFVVTDDVVIARGHTDYLLEKKVYDNLFVLHFVDDGRCSSFTDWYMKRPVAAVPDAP